MMLKPDQARRIAALLMEPEDDPPPPGLDGRSFGNYRVQRLVGVGGMGAVYEAHQDRTGRRVAIKVIRPELISAELSRRFEHEVRVLARLQHPGIAQVYEAGHLETPGGHSPYFAMEFVEGRPLTTYAAEQKLSLREKLELFLRVCDAVEHAHRKGVIHRDLKPGNILVDAAGQPRILDFGVARATDADLAATTLHTEIGKLIGTLPYMSPEQVSGDPDALDTRSDVYSLGVVLYELLAGKPPYEISRGRIHEAARVIREQEPARLASLDSSLRGDLDIVASTALAKERDRRYQSVADLASDVRRHLSGEPIQARASSRTYRIRKLLARNKWASGLAAALLVALVAGLVVSIREASIALRAQAGEQAQLARAADRAKEAEKQAAIANAARRFLVDVLSSANPGKRGKDVRVTEILDEGARQLASRFGSDPETEAEMHAVLAETYEGLGELEKVEQERRASLAVFQRQLGDSSTRTLRAMNDLGVVLVARGAFDEAQSLYEKAVAGERAAGDEPAALTTTNNLAGLLADHGKSEEALSLYKQVSDGFERLYGPDSPKAVTALSNTAVVLMELHRFSEAEPICRRILAQYEKPGVASPSQLVSALINLASCLKEQGKPADAEPLAKRAVDTAREVLGPHHPRIIGALNCYGNTLQDQRRYDDAEAPLKEATEAASAAYPPGHWLIGLTRSEHGRNLRLLKRFDDAEPELLQGFEILRTALGPEHPRTRMAEGAVRALYIESQKPEKAATYRQFVPPK